MLRGVHEIAPQRPIEEAGRMPEPDRCRMNPVWTGNSTALAGLSSNIRNAHVTRYRSLK
jgi:hypothetical protein